MGINTRALGTASALAAASIFVVCSIFVALAPGLASGVFSWVFHIDITSLARPISLGGFVAGLLVFSAFIGAFAAAAGWMYNAFDSRKAALSSR